MRIITGLLKGRTIDTPQNADVRPTTDRVKEGLFSVIESRRFIQNRTVLDLFAGTGNLGFEALSRGAEKAVFVDHDHVNIKSIDKMARMFEMENQVSTVKIDAAHFLEGPAVPYDLVFADPPYVYRDVEKIARAVIENGWLKEDGWLVLEHNKHHDFSKHPHFLFNKKYGRTFVSFLQGAPVTSTE
ncbi:MAG: 16S rRNA (guanine(966)-N(2))-methyltransferase RsmD [Balneolaceae bacterium]|nr:16S rRNA (guanine(966)-N(2))-methyltransferase RsmD [Balneolaceae bacterium]